MPSWLPLSAIPRFDFSPDSGLSLQTPTTTSTPSQLPTQETLERDWRLWLRTLFARYLSQGGQFVPFAPHHEQFWSWLWSIELDLRSTPFIAIWPRGGGKSTNAELGCVALGARGRRHYALYVSATQAQADDHVQTIGGQLESAAFADVYPDAASRLVGKYGSARGWRRDRLRTASGFTIDALGLDAAVRGVKLDEARPDLIVLDDLDRSDDSSETISKKIDVLTRELLPAGSVDCVVLGVQNLIRSDGIFGQLADGTADWLSDRQLSGPVPALHEFRCEQRGGKTWITGGTPTWNGQDVAICQARINDLGLRAFLAECQHEESGEGRAFSEWSNDVHVCDPFEIPSEWLRFRAVDYGYGAPFCCLWGARAPWGQVFIYRELYGAGIVDSEQAAQILAATPRRERIRDSVGDPSMWTRSHNGRPVLAPADAYAEMGLVLGKASNERLAGKARVHEALYFDDDAQPMLQVLRGAAPNLVRTLPKLPKDPHNPEDVDTKAEDHAYDALRYLLATIEFTWPAREPARSTYSFNR